MAAAQACGGRTQDSAGTAVGGSPAVVGSVSSGGTPTADASTLPSVIGPDNQFTPISDGDVLALSSAACVGYSVECEPMLFDFELVLDISAGMLRVDAVTGLSDWSVAQSVVKPVHEFGGMLSPIGVSFFPNRLTQSNFSGAVDVSQCLDTSRDLPASQRLFNDAALTEAVAAATPMAGAGAPIEDAYRAAVDRIQTYPNFGNQRVIVLVTDGVPTLSRGCQGADSAYEPVDTSSIVAAIADAQQLGILTVVVGTPGSASTPGGGDARPWLSQAARAGGTSTCNCSDTGPKYCHVALPQTDATEGLAYALRRFTSCGFGCTIPIPWVPDGNTLDLSQTEVVYRTGTSQQLILQNTSSDCQYGWHFTEGNESIEICTETCATLSCEPHVTTMPYFMCKTPGYLY